MWVIVRFLEGWSGSNPGLATRHKEILGFYAAESEGAHFWLGVLNDLKARGVSDILIACIDGLKGFPEALNAAFPQTEVQLCVVHQIRNSLKHIGSSNQKEFIKDLKTVYQAETLDLAEHNLEKLVQKWGSRYPIVIKSWKANWEHLTAYFKYSPDIRCLIYTTNPIEGFHRQVRKYTKTKGAFTSEMPCSNCCSVPLRALQTNGQCPYKTGH